MGFPSPFPHFLLSGLILPESRFSPSLRSIPVPSRGLQPPHGFLILQLLLWLFPGTKPSLIPESSPAFPNPSPHHKRIILYPVCDLFAETRNQHSPQPPKTRGMTLSCTAFLQKDCHNYRWSHPCGSPSGADRGWVTQQLLNFETCRGEKGYLNPPAPQPITALYVRQMVLNLVSVGQGQAPQSCCPVSRLIPGSEWRKGLHCGLSAQEPRRAVLLQIALNTALQHWG